jgi:hypothetical protein
MKEVRMRVFLVAIVVVALLAGACCGASQYRRFSASNFVWTGGPLALGDIVVVDVFVQGVGEDWVKVADDVPWPDVTIEFVWPDWANAPWPLPVDNSDERARLDVQAMIDGELYEYSCLMDWDAWNTISVECAAIEVPAP